MKRFPFAALLAVLATACATSRGTLESPQSTGTSSVILASEVTWEQLNPARGDQSPKAATLWGDRSASTATGFLLNPVDGFESPPHAHNVAYRGVVIRGLIHNDDPGAATTWMGPGSFWTQPAGEVHVTAARGSDTLAYIETDDGPYRVLPPAQAFDDGERSVNVDSSNVVWLDSTITTWVPASESRGAARVAYLWGTPEPGRSNGTFLSVPAGYAGTIRSHAPAFRAVVIKGRPSYRPPGETGSVVMEPGSHLSSSGAVTHRVSCESADECVLYVRTQGAYEVRPDAS